jgi:hypothetical protein
MLVRRPSPIALPALGLVAALAWPREARAQSSHHGVSPGLSFGVSFGERTSFSLGLDVRYSYLPNGADCGGSAWGFGPFGQAALLIGSGGVAGRFALGAHGGGSPTAALQPSAELGWTYRTAYGATRERPEIPGWHGLHVGLASYFFVAEELSVRGAIPLGARAAKPEMTIALGGRFPPPYGLNGFCVSGRPLRSGDEVVLPPVVTGDAREPACGTRDGVMVSALAEAWLSDARIECASIPVFVALARDLAQVGAPLALVARALGAADDEAVHTLLCAAVASQLSGTLAAPALLAPPPASDAGREEALGRLAVESWRDGCLGEGAAAERARRAVAHTRHPLARAAHARIAVDEQRHADLAWDVLRWCVATGGPAVAEALAAELAAANDGASGCAARIDDDAWRAHGRLDGDTIAAAWATQRAAAQRDGGRLLRPHRGAAA